MAFLINDYCVICGACEAECPNQAIYEPGVSWSMADSTRLKNQIFFKDGKPQSTEQRFPALSDEIFYIVPEKCTECVGFHEEPLCAAVCPVDACVPDPDFVESLTELKAKKAWLHQT
jgi:ferredoxin